MDYRHRVFVAVANNLSFSKAAEELFISQPAVTRHIKELESHIGTALFLRKGNRISLTPAGEITYRYAQKAQNLYAEMEHEIGSLTHNYTGQLRIGASSTMSQYIIPPLLAEFHQRYPNIELTLMNGNSFEMEQMLNKDLIDLALVENESSRSDLRYIKFMNDEIVVIAGSNTRVGRKKKLSLPDLQNLPMVVRERGSGTLEVIEHQLKHAGISLEKLNILLHLGSTEAIKSFLPYFEGIGLVSLRSIEKEIQLNLLRILPVTNFSILRHFRIVLPKGPATGFTEKFVQFLETNKQA
ncbi:LysR family transcriptional regulator [Marinilabiliaceae bacterium JC017]|nr:LysR family transcriptional regulator [Marinilabiliaceae bacterium JC017]